MTDMKPDARQLGVFLITTTAIVAIVICLTGVTHRVRADGDREERERTEAIHACNQFESPEARLGCLAILTK